MIQKLIIFSFIIAFILSIKLYISRDMQTLREKFQASNSGGPSIIVENIHSRRYESARLTNTLKADLGRFVEPNEAEFQGSVEAVQFSKDKNPARIRSELAIGTFNSDGMASLMTKATLQTIEAREFVQINFADSFLKTDSAKLTMKTMDVISNSPVSVNQGKHWFNAKDGFKLNLNKETAEFFGPTEGQYSSSP